MRQQEGGAVRRVRRQEGGAVRRVRRQEGGAAARVRLAGARQQGARQQGSGGQGRRREDSGQGGGWRPGSRQERAAAGCRRAAGWVPERISRVTNYRSTIISITELISIYKFSRVGPLDAR